MTSGLGRSCGTRKGRKEKGVHALRPVSFNHFKYKLIYVSLIAGKQKSPLPEGGAGFSDSD